MSSTDRSFTTLISDQQIVDDDSATLGFPHERKQWILANHSNICKFRTKDDIGYERVAGALWELIEDSFKAIPCSLSDDVGG